MRKRMLQFVAVGVLVSVSCSYGATRIASVYMESLSSVQSTAYRAAELFGSPELGTAPMMLNRMPGFMQIDKQAPVAVHFFATDASGVAMVADVKPAAGGVDSLLRALQSRDMTNQIEAVDGFYDLGRSVAHLHGDRLLVARSAEDLAVAMAAGFPAVLPEIAGLLRLDVAPVKLAGVIDDLQTMAALAMQQDAQQRDAIEKGMGLYRRALEQMATYQIGIGVGARGLEIRGRILPQPGRALEGVMQSMQPVDLSWLAKLDEGDLVAMVSGAYEVPDRVMKSLVDAYVELLKLAPKEAGMDPELMRKMFEPSLATVGAPAFLFGNVDAGMQFSMYGGMLMEKSADYLKEMIGLTQSAEYQALLAKSGMKVTEPIVREVAGNPVYRWEMDVDKDEMLAQMRAKGAEDPTPEDLAAMETMINLFLKGYDYGATDKGLVFGMGTETGLEQAMRLLAGGGNAEGAGAILKQAGAPVTPYSVGRMDLIGLLKLGMKLGKTPVQLPDSAKGEGIWFTGWRSGAGVEHLMVVPAADIRLMRETMQSSMPARGQRR